MSTRNVLYQMAKAANQQVLPDPGNAGTIDLKNRSSAVLELVSAGAETRTLRAPTSVGQAVLLTHVTDGGDITVTVTNGFNETGDTTFVFSDPGQFAYFISTKEYTSPSATPTYHWRLISHYGIANASPTEVGALDGLLATVAELNAHNAAASRLVNVPDAANYSVLAADSGKIHLMPDFTASCTLTLPTAATGLEYEFISKAVAADAQNWIFTSPAPFLKGGIVFLDQDAGAAADEVVSQYPNGSSHVTLTVTTPAGGTRLKFICDGTNWFVSGTVVSNSAPAFS